MTRLQVRPMPHAVSNIMNLFRHNLEDGASPHDVMRIIIRRLFDRGVTDAEALDSLHELLLPEHQTAAGISKLAMEFSKLFAVMEETFHYSLRYRSKSQMKAIYIPMGADYAVLTGPIEVLTAMHAVNMMSHELNTSDLVYPIEVPAGFNQLIAANAKGADTLLQEVIDARLNGKQLPDSTERGYLGREAVAYDEAYQEIARDLAYVYHNLLKTGLYDYRVEHTSDWEVVVTLTRKHAKLEVIKSDPEPDEKEPA